MGVFNVIVLVYVLCHGHGRDQLAVLAPRVCARRPGPYRDALVRGWVARCRAASIPMAVAVAGGEPFNLAATLATPVQIRDWGMQVRGAGAGVGCG